MGKEKLQMTLLLIARRLIIKELYILVGNADITTFKVLRYLGITFDENLGMSLDRK